MIRRHHLFRSLVFLGSALLSSCGGTGPGAADSPTAVALVAPATGSISLLAGGLGGSGNRDANGTDARFNQPLGIAVAADGTRYVADNLNHTIRKISPAGDVTTLAGEPGVSGNNNGVGSAAHFNSPSGLALGSGGVLYVADTGNYLVRQVDPDGTVSTLAGTAGIPGTSNGTGTAASFGTFYQIAMAVDGNLYVADTENHVIRRVTPAGVVETLAGMFSTSGLVNDNGTAARFNLPTGIASAGSNGLYVVDSGNQCVRRVTLAGDVSTVAGGGSASYADGPAASARFNSPFGVAVAADGTAYVSDFFNLVIRRISPDGQVDTLAGKQGEAGSRDGTGNAARFNYPTGVAIDPNGGLWVTDIYSHSLRHVSDAGVVTTPVGQFPKPDYADAVGDQARFNVPGAVAVGPDGAVYVADIGNHAIRKVAADGTVTTFAGLPGTSGFSDGAGSAARFLAPSGIAVDIDGTVYVADTGNQIIRRITPAGVVSTLAGGVQLTGSTDGTGTSARFKNPLGVAIDGAGNVYVADAGNHVLRKITQDGVVTTLAGLAGTSGIANGSGNAARFNSPQGVAVDVDGTVYVADTGNHSVRKVTAAGDVSLLAGGAGVAGYAEGNGADVRFRGPVGIAVDTNHNVYVNDNGNHLLRQITAAGDASTLAGVAGVSGVVQGALPGGLNLPLGLTIGLGGELYVSSENAILKVTLPVPAPLFHVDMQAASTSIYLGQDVNLRWAARDATNCVASGDWSGAQANAGTATLTPAVTGSFTYTLTCDENGGSGTGHASVTVNVTDPPPDVTLSASASPIAQGSPVTLTWSSTGTTACTASGAWSGSRGTSGSEVVTPPLGSQSFTLTCTGPAGSASKTVTVSVLGPPTVALAVTPTSLTLGQSLVLNWTSTSATSCSASGAWAGVRSSTGSTSLTPAGTGTYVYSIACTGPAGTASDSVSVVVSAAAGAPAPAAGGGGGALGLEGLAPLALLAALRDRRRRREGPRP